MRTLLVIVALVSVAGPMGVEVAAQEAPTFVWERSCDTLPSPGSCCQGTRIGMA